MKVPVMFWYSDRVNNLNPITKDGDITATSYLALKICQFDPLTSTRVLHFQGCAPEEKSNFSVKRIKSGIYHF